MDHIDFCFRRFRRFTRQTNFVTFLLLCRASCARSLRFLTDRCPSKGFDRVFLLSSFSAPFLAPP